MGTQVFISYSSKDSKIAREICFALESRWLSCWISSRDAGPVNFMDAIVNAISAVKVMVLVFSENANNSDADIDGKLEVQRGIRRLYQLLIKRQTGGGCSMPRA